MAEPPSGRAANGGARTTGGPVPVSQADRQGIRTPQMIMNARRQKAEAEAQRKVEEEQRRRSAERRAQAVAGVASGPAADPGGQRQPQSTPMRGDPYQTYPSSSGVPRQPEQRGPSSQPDTLAGASQGRARASSQSQQQPRPAANQPASVTGDSRRPPPAQHARRPSAAAGSSQAGPSTAAPPPRSQPAASSSAPPRDSATSTFQHAFERWETLSSHWEGLTSYWIRRLEANTNEVRREPLAQQMSRQITDLSAAGANLFHAVVELQRLRASSERKFQRWFYEHRQEQDRFQEREAQVEGLLRTEREGRAEAEKAAERMATEKKNAERAVAEMKRELQISKEEARRAWEELGRREQEERDRTHSLREGHPTLVGGMQVVPVAQNVGVGSALGVVGGAGSHTGAPSSASGIEGHYSYEEGQSPTDTDPFTEGSRHTHHERDTRDIPVLPSYVPSGSARAPASSHSAEHTQYRTTLPPHTSAATQPTTSRPEAFYQQPSSYLHQSPNPANSSSGPFAPTTTHSHPPHHASTGPAQARYSTPNDDVQSYVTSEGTYDAEDADPDDAEEEYAIDARGNYLLDAQGRRILFRAAQSPDPRDDAEDPEADEYDVALERRRELEHLSRYGTTSGAASGVAAPSHHGGSGSLTGGGRERERERPDYSGEEYGDEWAGIQGMHHHHPTRLSDVPEEDERSQASRGRLY